MTPFSEDYLVLRNDLVNIAVTQTQLNKLISEFHSEINSKRRSSYINSCEELIKVLEKRGYLESNFQNFARRLSVLIPEINTYEMMTRYQPGPRFPGVNHCGGSRLPAYSRQHSYGSVRSEFGSSETNTGTIQEIHNVLPQAAINRIVKDIGTNWKDLARELSIREGEIDEIECKHAGKLKEKARACLKIFIEETAPYKIQPKLLEALNNCGRRDLKESVQEILSRRPY